MRGLGLSFPIVWERFRYQVVREEDTTAVDEEGAMADGHVQFWARKAFRIRVH
jgi:hypothetical protein